MSTCEVEPLRHNVLRLCVSEGRFDFGALEALRTRVSYVEAQEIEAVLCVEGDNRHTFQTWYPKWAERQKKLGKLMPVQDLFESLTGGPIDVELVRRELVAANDSIKDTQATLADNRQAMLSGGKTMDDRTVDALELQLIALKNSRELLGDQLAKAGGG